MTKLEQLIAELCPDGVISLPLEEVFIMRNGYTPSKENKDFWTDGTLPWFRMEDLRQNGGILSDSLQHITPEAVKGNLFPANSIIMATTATIGEHALLIADSLANQQFTFFTKNVNRLTAQGLELDMRFAYYYFFIIDEWCKHNTNISSFPSVDMGKLKKYMFPLPPLPVQRKIVEVLDNFTELSAELSAELTARKKQYEYYRNELLTFGDDVPMVTLGEIATDIYRGAGITRDQVTPEGIPCVRYGEIYTTYNIWFDKCVSHTASGSKYFEHGDVLFAITGESVEEIAKSCVYMGHEKCLAGGDLVVLKHKQNPKYISYALSTTAAQMQKSKGKVKSKVVHSSVPAIKAIQIPLPSLEEQARIVAILDRFDMLTSDISNGLPAEIAARQKQYEYYRDKLLTFKGVSA